MLTMRNLHKDGSYCLQLLATLGRSQVLKHPTSGGRELNNMILQRVLKIPKSLLFFPQLPSAKYKMSQK